MTYEQSTKMYNLWNAILAFCIKEIGNVGDLKERQRYINIAAIANKELSNERINNISKHYGMRRDSLFS